MEEKYVCPCGLTCCDCMFYKTEIFDSARKLSQLIDESQINIFLSLMSKNEVNSAVAYHLNEDKDKFNRNFKPFENMDIFLEVLNGLANIQCKTTCRESGGCSMCGTTKECSAIKCLKDKKLNGCWECPDNTNCSNLIFLRKSYGETIDDNYKIINEKGIQALHSRGNNYYEWQKRMNKTANKKI